MVAGRQAGREMERPQARKPVGAAASDPAEEPAARTAEAPVGGVREAAAGGAFEGPSAGDEERADGTGMEALAAEREAAGDRSGDQADGDWPKEDWSAEALLASGTLAALAMWALFSRRGQEVGQAESSRRVQLLRSALAAEATDVQVLALREVVRDAVVQADAETLRQFVIAAHDTGRQLGQSPQMDAIRQALSEVNVEARWIEEISPGGRRPSRSLLMLRLPDSGVSVQVDSRNGVVLPERGESRPGQTVDRAFQAMSDAAWERFRQIQLNGGEGDNRYVRTLNQFLRAVGQAEVPPGEFHEFVRTHSYSVIPNSALSQITEFIGRQGAFELGAGTGYNAYLINETARRAQGETARQGGSAGLVTAYDIAPVGRRDEPVLFRPPAELD